MKTCTHGFEKYSQMLLGENQYSIRISICLDIERRLYKFFYASAVNIRDLLFGCQYEFSIRFLSHGMVVSS